MTPVSNLFKEKKFPKWFTSHSVFDKITAIDKIFPKIGLPNCEEEIDLNTAETAKTAAITLVGKILQCITYRIDNLRKYVSSKETMGDARKVHAERTLTLLGLISILLKDSGECVKETNGRLSLKLPADVIVAGDERPTFREGQSLFRIYNKLNELLGEGKFAKLQRLEDSYEFKTFSNENVPNNKLKIAFSSDDIVGAWDIATMSMRGVSSCQSWNGEYKHCVIGSVIDPFVGIVYLTNGGKFNEHGSRMIRRCIVRFVVDGKTNKPYLLVDNMYPGIDNSILDRFKKFLSDRTNGKFDIRYAPSIEGKELQSTYMPLTKMRKLLKCTNEEGDGVEPEGDLDSIASYQDIKVTDKISNKNDINANRFAKNVDKKIRKFKEEFSQIFTEAIKSLDVAEFPDSIRPTIRKLKGKGKEHFSYAYIIPSISNSIANMFVDNVDRNGFTSSDLYMTRVYANYFNSRSKTLEINKAKITRELNGKLQLKKGERLRSEHFIAMMNVMRPVFDAALKKSLKDLITKHKTSVLPLP